MIKFDVPDPDSRIALTPTQVVTTGGTRREYEYDFANVDVEGVGDRLDSIFTGASMKAIVHDGCLYYQYGLDASPVFCDGTEVFCGEDADVSDAEQDAYFMLSMCDEHGYVSRWRKK